MKKDIIILTISMGNDGAERILSELSREWIKLGNRVTIIQTGANNYGVSYKLDNNIKIVNIHAKSKIKPIRYMQEIRQIVSYLNKHPKATVISFIVASIFNCGVASLFVKNKIVVSERNNPKECPAGKIRQIMRDWAFSRADVCVFQTEEAMKMFPKSVQRKGVIIPNPINGNLPIPYTGVREKRIVAACRLHPQKNLPMLIKAFYYLHRDYPDYVLEVYGQGDERERLENMIRKLNLEQNVRLPGFADDIHDKMLKAAMYVSSSNYEGISNSMLEAMGMGVPTVVTDCPVGGARLMITNEVNGILVPVGDVKALYNGMKKIISEKVFANKISNEAVKVNDKYQLNKICKIWLDLL